MRLGCIWPKSLNLVFLVSLEVSFEPVPLIWMLIGSFMGKNVSCNPVQEPAIVSNHDCTAWKLKQGIFQ